MFGLHLVATHDRLNLRRAATSEHFARQILHVQLATRCSFKTLDFTGLKAYTAHLECSATPMRIPAFDKFVVEEQKCYAEFEDGFTVTG